jgi:hypothetical protein
MQDSPTGSRAGQPSGRGDRPQASEEESSRPARQIPGARVKGRRAAVPERRPRLVLRPVLTPQGRRSQRCAEPGCRPHCTFTRRGACGAVAGRRPGGPAGAASTASFPCTRCWPYRGSWRPRATGRRHVAVAGPIGAAEPIDHAGGHAGCLTCGGACVGCGTRLPLRPARLPSSIGGRPLDHARRRGRRSPRSHLPVPGPSRGGARGGHSAGCLSRRYMSRAVLMWARLTATAAGWRVCPSRLATPRSEELEARSGGLMLQPRGGVRVDGRHG